ncbi:MAG: hypothetical protein ACKPJO_20680, partial [Dolichospermum sp.]
HESCLIYSMGKIKQLYNSSGLYQDVNFPGILVESCTVESVIIDISELLIQQINSNKSPWCEINSCYRILHASLF